MRRISTKVNKEKLYSILNNVKFFLWIFATIFGLAGMYTHRNYLMHITAYILFVLGVSQIVMYAYFRKSFDLGVIFSDSKYSAFFTFILSAAQFYGGYYILVHFP